MLAQAAVILAATVVGAAVTAFLPVLVAGRRLDRFYAVQAQRGRIAVLCTLVPSPLLVLLARPGAHDPSLAAAVCLALAAGISPWLVRIDIALHRLPDRIVLPGVAIAASLLAAGALRGHEDASRMLGAALLAGTAALLLWGVPLACAGALIGLRRLAGHEAGDADLPMSPLGLGDVKFAPLWAAVAVWHSWAGLPLAFAATALSAVAVTGLGLVTGRITWRDRIAYGPYLITGMWTAAVLTRFVL